MGTYSEIISATSGLNQYEIIFVNDGSPDNSELVLNKICNEDKKVTAIAIICGWFALWRQVGLLWLLGIAGLAGILSSMITIA